MLAEKKKFSVDEQLSHLRQKGITFTYCSEEAARDYLQNNTYFFKIRAYRKNYPKHADGKEKGKYINLDFQYLIDLAVLDMQLRYLLIQIALDVEHYVRMQLVRYVETINEDGYSIINDYLDSLSEEKRNIFLFELERNKENIYCGAISEKYNGRYPIWAFVEIISFGRLISFYNFCANRFQDKKMKNNYYRLMACKEIRNAAAHNNCILNELHSGTAKYQSDNDVNRALMQIKGVTKTIRKRKMSNARVQQIVTLLYTHKTMVTSQAILEKESEKLNVFSERMLKNMVYYQENDVIKTTFSFLKMVIDNWYPVAYNKTTEKK